MDKYERLEIHERCLRDTKNDQLWEAYAARATMSGFLLRLLSLPVLRLFRPLFKIGPTVESYSRKNARTKARTAFEAQRV